MQHKYLRDDVFCSQHFHGNCFQIDIQAKPLGYELKWKTLEVWAKVLFLEIDRVKKIFITYLPSQSNMYQNIHFLFKKNRHTHTQKKQTNWKKKTKNRNRKTKEGKRWKQKKQVTMILLANLLCVLDWVVNFSCEFCIVYVRREKSQYFLYCNNVQSMQFQE